MIGESWGEFSQQVMPEPVWLVEDMLSEGFMTFSGKPKDGKSVLALMLAVAVASGRHLLGQFPVRQAGALYLSYEDHPAIIQERLKKMVPDGVDCSESLRVAYEKPVLDENGLQQVEGFFRANPSFKLLILDTLFQGLPKDQRSASYANETEVGNRLRKMADDLHITIIAVHHSVKGRGRARSMADMLRGTLGLPGATSGIMLLEQTKDDGVLELLIKGKRIPYQNHLLTMVDDGSGWQLYVPDDTISEARAAIIEVLEAAGRPVGLPFIYGALQEHGDQRGHSAVRKILREMVADGQIACPSRGLYSALDLSAEDDQFDANNMARDSAVTG
jgi:hypothetical protein